MRIQGRNFRHLLLLLNYSLAPATAVTAQDLQHHEQAKTGWAFHVDNDALISDDRDEDYTGGIAFAFSGRQAVTNPLLLESPREKADKLLGIPALYTDKRHFNIHSVHFGLAFFTPNDIGDSNPIFDERPYASLFFLSNTQQSVLTEHRVYYQSALTLGLLGLSAAEEIQQSIHNGLDVTHPQGWQHQISQGGELTGKYSLSMHRNLAKMHAQNGWGQEFNLSAEANVGFTTDASLGFTWRMGLLSRPWWTFNPQHAEYIDLGSPVTSAHRTKAASAAFFYFGGAITYRIYNALLEGQFRSSTVTYSRNELEDFIFDLWGGVSLSILDDTSITLVVRARTAELRSGNNYEPAWGGITLTHSY